MRFIHTASWHIRYNKTVMTEETIGRMKKAKKTSDEEVKYLFIDVVSSLIHFLFSVPSLFFPWYTLESNIWPNSQAGTR